MPNDSFSGLSPDVQAAIDALNAQRAQMPAADRLAAYQQNFVPGGAADQMAAQVNQSSPALPQAGILQGLAQMIQNWFGSGGAAQAAPQQQPPMQPMGAQDVAQQAIDAQRRREGGGR